MMHASLLDYLYAILCCYGKISDTFMVMITAVTRLFVFGTWIRKSHVEPLTWSHAGAAKALAAPAAPEVAEEAPEGRPQKRCS